MGFAAELLDELLGITVFVWKQTESSVSFMAGSCLETCFVNEGLCCGQVLACFFERHG